MVQPPVFADSSALVAFLLPTDEHAPAARQWIAETDRFLVTSDYVLDETYTMLLKKTKNHQWTADKLRKLLESKLIKLEFVSGSDFWKAKHVFETFLDKEWSFTDCTSKVVMERLGLQTAFAFDRDFSQFPVIVQPTS